MQMHKEYKEAKENTTTACFQRGVLPEIFVNRPTTNATTNVANVFSHLWPTTQQKKRFIYLKWQSEVGFYSKQADTSLHIHWLTLFYFIWVVAKPSPYVVQQRWTTGF